MDIEVLKQHLRVDGNEEDALIARLAKAAEMYVTNATGYSFETTRNELADLAVITLVIRWYENREMIGQGNLQDVGLTSILTQLSLCGGWTA